MRVAILFILVSFFLLGSASAAGQLRASTDQLFWVNGSWVPASDLRPGDQFTTADGRVAIVTNVTPVQADDELSCYDLHTEVPHDIFADGVLAHDAVLPRRSCNLPAVSVPAQTPWQEWADSLRKVWRALRDALNKRAMQGDGPLSNGTSCSAMIALRQSQG
jgi:hypothetical protein